MSIFSSGGRPPTHANYCISGIISQNGDLWIRCAVPQPLQKEQGDRLRALSVKEVVRFIAAVVLAAPAFLCICSSLLTGHYFFAAGVTFATMLVVDKLVPPIPVAWFAEASLAVKALQQSIQTFAL